MLVLNLLRYLLFILVCFVVARPSYAARLAINVIPAYQRVDLNWAEVSGAVSYRLCAASVKIHNFANCGKDGNSQLLEINTGNTAIKATGLVNGATYHFRVLAVNAKGLTVSDSGDKTAIPRELALNDTGITTCYDYNYARPCPVNNFPGQDAEFGRDRLQFNDSNGVAGFNFTKIGADGEALPVTATRWNCVKDEMTGLMWEVKTKDGGLHDWEWHYSWYEPDSRKNGGHPGYQDGGVCGDTSACDTDAYVQAVNAAGWCGYKDWRLPTMPELLSIINFGQNGVNIAAIDTVFFPNTHAGKWGYWSATPSSSGSVWSILPSGDDEQNSKPYSLYVRLVRGK